MMLRGISVHHFVRHDALCHYQQLCEYRLCTISRSATDTRHQYHDTPREYWHFPTSTRVAPRPRARRELTWLCTTLRRACASGVPPAGHAAYQVRHPQCTCTMRAFLARARAVRKKNGKKPQHKTSRAKPKDEN
eukprot:1656437-Rhodomonas_salina.1